MGGLDAANGLYVRKEAAEGPPAAWDLDNDPEWTERNTCHWYEKDNGCFIFQEMSGGGSCTWWAWKLRAPFRFHAPYCKGPHADTGFPTYTNPGPGPHSAPTDDPPSQGWKIGSSIDALPVPTLRVVP